MEPMYLRDVETYDAPGERGDAIRHMKADGIPVPQIQHLFAYKPNVTEHMAEFTQAVMRGPSPLTPGLRELIAAFTSELNKCPF